MSAAGIIMAYADHATKIIIDNCHVTNSSISSSAEYVGGLIGFSSADTTVISNCSVTGTTISGYKSTGAIIAHVAGATTVSTVTSTGNTITGNTTGREWGVGAIFGRSSRGCNTTMTAITISDNTISQEGATSTETNDYYGTSYGATTLDGNAV